MEGLKKLIQDNEKYSKFKLYINSIENDIVNKNTNGAIEGTKGLIESVCKTISGEVGTKINDADDLPRVVKKTVENLPFIRGLEEKDAEKTRTLCGSIITLSKTIGELRNEYGFISHGQDINSTRKADEAISGLACNVADILCSFLIELHINYSTLKDLRKINYEDYSDFNEWLDETNEKIKMAGFEYLYSETLFRTDEEAYKSSLLDYQEELKTPKT